MCYTDNICIPCKVNSRMVHALVYFVQGLGSQVYFSLGDRRVSAKSIIGVLSLGLYKDADIKVSTFNEDCKLAEHELKLVLGYLRKMGE